MPKPNPFSRGLKEHLTGWNVDSGRNYSTAEQKWVLKNPADNYFNPAWMAHIAGKMHRWAHAMNSSQAFAVNLFGPARGNKGASLALWQALAADVSPKVPQNVNVHFEYGGPASVPLGNTALGEQRQTTQIDVALHAQYASGKTRFLLIEVKLSESSFGTCRGAKHGGENCNRLDKILANPAVKCWLTKNEKRKYWPLIQSGQRGLEFSSIADGSCPWKSGLYQLMRNWAFGQALVQTGGAEDFYVGVCIHPKNTQAPMLKVPVGGTNDLITAFDRLISKGRVLRVDPERVIGALAPFANEKWADYVRTRYQLGQPG